MAGSIIYAFPKNARGYEKCRYDKFQVPCDSRIAAISHRDCRACVQALSRAGVCSELLFNWLGVTRRTRSVRLDCHEHYVG